MVAWGALIGGAVAGIGSILGARESAGAARAAGRLSQKQYKQTRADLAPWRGTGGAANYELSALYGLPGDYPGGGGLGERGDPRAGAGPAPVNQLAGAGRGGDTELAHVTPGEAVVPGSIMRRPGVMNALRRGFEDEGMDFSRYIVGSGRNSRNPRTGGREFLYGASTSEGGATGFGGGDPRGGSEYEDRWRSFRKGVAGVGGVVAGALPGPIGAAVKKGFDKYGGMQTVQEVRAAYPGTYGPPRIGEGADADRGGFSRLLGYGGAGGGAGPTNQLAGGGLPEGYWGQDAAIQRFYDSPDYRLAFDEGAGAIERSAAGRGGLFGGNTGAELTRYGQQLGGTRYDQYYNHLMGLSGLGQNAAAMTGNIGMQSAGQQGNALMAGGQAQAQGIYGVGNAINRGIENYWLMNMLGKAA